MILKKCADKYKKFFLAKESYSNNHFLKLFLRASCPYLHPK
ncbi:hypothetical protein NY78_2746 [Desulfovibrio sp. TomC]|nr:hypothetical protein NY78_2746 [Desulfovibrio sp. TomC]